MAFREQMSVGELKVEETAYLKKLVLGGDPKNESTTTGKSIIDDVDFTIGAESTNDINVGIQLKSGGADLDHSAVVFAYLSDSATGIAIAASAPATSVAIGTDGSILVEHTAKLAWTLDSETDGDIDLTIVETGDDVFYLVVVANGVKFVSGAITFTT